MAKWRIKKDPEPVHWLYPWVVTDPIGWTSNWASWQGAMGYIAQKQQERKNKWWRNHV